MRFSPFYKNLCLTGYNNWRNYTGKVYRVAFPRQSFLPSRQEAQSEGLDAMCRGVTRLREHSPDSGSLVQCWRQEDSRWCDDEFVATTGIYAIFERETDVYFPRQMFLSRDKISYVLTRKKYVKICRVCYIKKITQPACAWDSTWNYLIERKFSQHS